VNELLKQLTVVKPTNPLMFSIPGVSNLIGLALTDSFVAIDRHRFPDSHLTKKCMVSKYLSPMRLRR